MKPPIFFTTGTVEAILRDAGKTLMQLPHTGPRPVLRLSVALCSLVTFEEGVKSRLQLPAPESASISEMDRVYGWLSYIPQDKYVLRRIVGARSLIDSVTGRHVYSWRAIGRILGATTKQCSAGTRRASGSLPISLTNSRQQGRYRYAYR